MLDWVPIRCTHCNAIVGAAPEHRGPVVAICVGCSPRIVTQALAVLAPDRGIERERYLPVKARRAG